MSYKFTLQEFHPVAKVELLSNNKIEFWYEGEETRMPPSQTIPNEGPWGPQEDIYRPVLGGPAAKVMKDQGEDACIRHLNRRIANYILDHYEEVRDSCPVKLEKLYLDKIDEFYLWFWQRRDNTDRKLFGRFLLHIQSIRQKQNLSPTWYTLKEAAIYTRAGVTKLRELKDNGKLKPYTLDDAKSKSTILFHRKDLDSVILFDRSKGLNRRQQDKLKAYQS
jgi:hypothetical protein